MWTTPAQIAVTEVAGEKARYALSMLILAGGLTSTIMWPLTGILQAQWGWRAITMLYAALILLICTPLHWTTLARRPKTVVKTDKAGEPAAINLKQFILLATSFAANGFFTWGFALTIIILLEAKGLDHASALSAAAFIGIAQWAGRMLDFVGGRRWSGLPVALTGAALFPLSFIILLLSNGMMGAVLFSTLYGVASGITAVARATLPLQLFPPGAYARTSARMAVPLNLAFATAPPAFTAIMTAASPQVTLWLAFAISVFAFVMLSSLSAMHRRVTAAAA
jgi:MFS family permease